MPEVNGKHFPYTPEGYKAAKALARKTGKKMKKGRKYDMATQTWKRS